MRTKLQVYVLVITLLMFVSVAFAATIIYDKFNRKTLDTTKWSVTCGDVLGCVPVVGVNMTTKTFEIAQPTPHGIGAATATYLTLIGHTFNPGETLEFDVNYSENIGNQVIGFQFDTLPPAPCFSCFGYWNGVVDDGNLAGVYHFKINFLDDKQIYIEIKKPDNAIVTRYYSYSTDDPIFYASAATGHNGILRIDYDNFVIKTTKGKK